MDEVGKFRVHKIIHLASVIFKIVFIRIAKNVKVLYYPPAVPERILNNLRHHYPSNAALDVLQNGVSFSRIWLIRVS